MDIEEYRKLIKSIVEKHSEGDNDNGEIETQIAFDLERDRYLMFPGLTALFRMVRYTIKLISFPCSLKS